MSGMAPRILERMAMKDGRIAEVSFLCENDGARELQRHINSFVEEGAMLIHDRKVTLKEEAAWKKRELEKFRKREGYQLVARVGGKMAATSGGNRHAGRERNNVVIGIAVARPYRGLGIGEALLRLNIKVAKRMLKPKNIYLSVFAGNKAARALYTKVGFRKFAVYPKWMLYKGKYMDDILMKL